MGSPRTGSIRNSDQYQAVKVYLEAASPSGGSDRCSLSPLDMWSGLCLPSPASYSKISDETNDRNHNGNNSPTVLAETPLVPHSNVPEYPASSQDSNNTCSSVTRMSHPSRPAQVESSHLTVERQKFQSLGFSAKVFSQSKRAINKQYV